MTERSQGPQAEEMSSSWSGTGQPRTDPARRVTGKQGSCYWFAGEGCAGPERTIVLSALLRSVVCSIKYNIPRGRRPT